MTQRTHEFPDQPASFSDAEKLERCMSLFSEHQRRLSLFISTMISSPADADEVLQETNMVIWRKFDNFDPENPKSDFLSWAYRIAHYQALDYRRRMAKKMLSLSPEVMDQLGQKYMEDEPIFEARLEALKGCMKKLEPQDRELVEASYAPKAQMSIIAEKLKRTPTSVYRSLRRIRQLLLDCVKASTGEEEVQPS